MKFTLGKLFVEIRYNDIKTPILEKLRAGQFIQAIKLHRDLTGSRLKDAKEYCEKLRASDWDSMQIKERLERTRSGY